MGIKYLHKREAGRADMRYNQAMSTADTNGIRERLRLVSAARDVLEGRMSAASGVRAIRPVLLGLAGEILDREDPDVAAVLAADVVLEELPDDAIPSAELPASQRDAFLDACGRLVSRYGLNVAEMSVRGEFVSEGMLREMRSITAGATLLVGEVEYVPNTGLLSVPILRQDITGVKDGGGLVKDKDVRVRCLITIRSVRDVRVENRLPLDSTESGVTVLFGLSVVGSKVKLASVEKCGESPCYAIEAEVSYIDISLSDDNRSV